MLRAAQSLHVILWVIADLLCAAAIMTAGPAAKSITISGTVTGPRGPVANVWIGVGAPGLDWQTVTTSATGSYSLTLQADGQVFFMFAPTSRPG